MGCSPSSPTPASNDLTNDNCPPTPIPVDIGTGIRHQLNNDVIIVFIFGGPASQKGLIIQELTASFNFISVSVEDIVFNYLPNRVANTIESIGEIQEVLKRDQGILTIDWILKMISAKLSTSVHQRYVIDIVPTLTSIMKAESYRARSHERSLEIFERVNPIAFALDITVADERALLNRTEGTDRKDGEKNGSAEMNQFMKGVDDIDKGRLEKRFEEYHQCSDPFLRYFQKSRRIVRLSLCSQSFNNLVNTVREILLDFGFTLTRRDDHIIAFSTEQTLDESNLIYYKMKVIHADQLSSGSDSLNSQIAAVHKYITSHARRDDNFLVIVPNFKNNDITEFQKGKKINFMEKNRMKLDEIIKDKQFDKPPKTRFHNTVSQISSSRQVFVFFEPFPTGLAQNISLIYNKLKDGSSSRDNS